MTIHYAKGGRLHFNDLTLEVESVMPQVDPAGSDTCDFNATPKTQYTGHFTLDAESAKNVRGLMLRPYQKAAIDRIMGTTGMRFQQFDYHRAMVEDEGNRRFMAVPPSAARKSEVLHTLRTYGARLHEKGVNSDLNFAHPANVGKTTALDIQATRETARTINLMAQAMMANATYGKFGTVKQPRRTRLFLAVQWALFHAWGKA